MASITSQVGGNDELCSYSNRNTIYHVTKTCLPSPGVLLNDSNNHLTAYIRNSLVLETLVQRSRRQKDMFHNWIVQFRNSSP